VTTPFRRSYSRAAVLGLLLTPSPTSAELRHVRLDIPGLDCASCAEAARKTVSKLEGVESVTFSVETRSAEIRLSADNKVTLPQIRRAIRSHGFQSGDAAIDARGRFVKTGGEWSVDLLNGSALPLAEPPAGATDALVQITGVSRANDRNEEKLIVTSVK
jgi:copper chaperone CopZ